jgi:hypothetical protein
VASTSLTDLAAIRLIDLGRFGRRYSYRYSPGSVRRDKSTMIKA